MMKFQQSIANLKRNWRRFDSKLDVFQNKGFEFDPGVAMKLQRLGYPFEFTKLQLEMGANDYCTTGYFLIDKNFD